MNKIFYIPLFYSVYRETKRFKRSLAEAIIFTLSNHLLYYIWIPVYAVIIGGLWPDWSVLAVHFISFMIMYEAGYMLSDTFGIRFENNMLKRVVHQEKDATVITGVVFRLIIVMLLMRNAGIVVAYFWLTFLIFIVHSFISEKYRLATFMGLRIMKGFAPFASLIVLLAPDQVYLIMAGLLAHAVHNSMEYYSRKLGDERQPNFYTLKMMNVRLVTMLSTIVILEWLYRIEIVPSMVFILLMTVHHLVVEVALKFKKFISARLS